MSHVKTSATPDFSARPRVPAGYRTALSRALVGVLDTLLLWQARATERHRLAQQDARMLADMGISHAEAAEEAAKPFWKT